jgi:glycerol-1-phosphate dehydrogenase [NAD(P)+]
MAMFTASADWYLAAAMAGGARSAGSARDAGDTWEARPAGADPPYHAAVTRLTRDYGGRLLELAAALRGEPGALTAQPGALTAGPGASRTGPAARDADQGSLADLARLLTLSGIGMGVAGSTAPASGMEHAISHLLEMAASARGEPASFHGMQVGVASVVAAATWAHVRRDIAGGALDRPARLPDPDTARDRITRSFAAVDRTGAMAAECFSDYAVKLRRLSAADPLAGLRESWAEHEAVLDTLLAGPADVARALRLAGLPARFSELPEPVTDQTARWAVASCMLMRQRLSVADLAMLTGSWQDSDIDEVLADASAATAQIPGEQAAGP